MHTAEDIEIGQQSDGQAGDRKIAFHMPRRRDRAVQDELWITELLNNAPIGVLATSGESGPALNPNLFAFDAEQNRIYLHTAKTGQTRDNVEKRPRVSFCVAEMGRLLPADAAVHFSVEYASVVLEGRAAVVEDADEATRALDLLMRKYAPQFEPGHHYRGIEAKDLARTTVFRIDIERWTGKAKTSDASDAYAYGAVARSKGL